MIGHLDINFTEFQIERNGGYKGVEARYRTLDGKETKRLFNSGDPENDFANAVFWLGSIEGIDRVMMSSSCDHFTSDVPGWGWYENEIAGSLIKSREEKMYGKRRKEWHKIVKMYGKNEGRDCFIQEKGSFIVLDNKDGIQLVSPDGPVDAPDGKFATVEAAMEHCKGLKRTIRWE